MSTTQYFLSRDAHICFLNDHSVVLDLNNDKYLFLPSAEVRKLVAFLESSESSRLHECKALVDELRQRGLVTTCAHEGKSIARDPIVDRALTALTPATVTKLPDPRLMIRFFVATCVAAYRLKRWPIKRTVQAVQQRRSCLRALHPPIDIARAAYLVGVFNMLRSYFPRNYLCLFDSLALIEFLAANHIYPNWVFAVQTEPFEAHCWAQEGTVVLNDTMDRTGRYVPIMAV